MKHNTTKYKYLIIGAGTAGHFAAEEIRNHDQEGSICIVGEEPHRPYHRPPLSKGVITGKVNPMATYLKKDDFYELNDIEIKLGLLVTELDAIGKKVKLTDGSVLEFEKLLLATGGNARNLDIPGSDSGGVYTLRTLENAEEILAESKNATEAVIVGAGFISAEVATSLWKQGVHCTILIRGDYMLQRVLPREMQKRLHESAKDYGVTFVTNDGPAEFTGTESVEGVVTRNGRTIQCDIAVIGIGLDLNVELAHQAGLEMADDGGIRTNSFMRTSNQAIWAAGDIASYEDRTYERRMRVERTEAAKHQGKVAGASMAGVEDEPYSKMPQYTFHLFDLNIRVYGCFSSENLIKVGSIADQNAAYFAFNQSNCLEGYLGFGRPFKEGKLVRQQIRDKVTKEQIIEQFASTPERVLVDVS
jgi:NADPH-dependent 2,4-dienoyl-CoA reductase/sulfur reductase-like enzyme